MQDSMASFSKFRRALAASTASSTPKHLARHDPADPGNLPADPNNTLEEPGAVGRPL
jgi:hypothetical protein